MEREQFTFYSSFLKAAKRIKSKAARCDFYDAICNYAMNEQEPDLDKIAETAALGFVLVKPTLDSSRRKAESGKSGGKVEANGKQTGSKPEANRKQEEPASKKEDEKEDKKEKEYECTPPTPLGEVMSFFLDRINATPSPDCLDYLRQYTESLGAPVVLHALQIALDEKKTGFAYIKAILARYEREGLTTLEAVKAQEQAREAGKDAPKRKYVTASDYAAAPQKPVDMEKLRGVIDRI